MVYLTVASLFVSASGVSAQDARSTTQGELEEILAQTRTAVFGPSGLPGDKVIEVSGPAQAIEMDLVGSLVFDQRGRYLMRFDGPFDTKQGHDGEVTWEHNPNGNVQRLQAGNASFHLLFKWLMTSDWLIDRPGMSLSLGTDKKSSKFATIQVDAGDGSVGTVTIDRSSWLPTQMETEQYGRAMILKLQWGEELGDRVMLKNVDVIDGGKVKIKWQVERARFLESAPDFTQPNDSLRIVFDRDMSPKLKVKKASGGHFLVRPLIHGKDLGWFLFDTGASGTIIDIKLAKKLEMQRIGETYSTGIGGRSATQLFVAESLQLGGVRIENVPISSRDFSKKKSSYGVEIAGILGVDLLAQGIIVYDESEVEVEFHVPDTSKLPRGEWDKMPIHNGKPAIRMEYEGHVGLFMIDTGAPGRLIFSPQASERNLLLKGRKTKRARVSGGGGSVGALTGTIDYVVFGGKRFEKIPALFLVENEGAGADVLSDGIVGANLVRRFVVVFDIEGERIAYLPRE